MSNREIDPPSDATVRVLTRIALAWAVLGLVVQAVFAAVIAPALGDEVAYTIPGRGPTLAFAFDTQSVAVTGLVVTAVAILIAAANIFLAARSARSAYAIAVVVCIVIPGFVVLNLANGIFALGSGDGTAGGASIVVALLAVAGVAVGAISIAEAAKIAQRSKQTA